MNTTLERALPGHDRRGRMLMGAFALGLMVSPDNLALLGGFAGHFGIYTPLILVAGAFIYVSYARSYENLYILFSMSSEKIPAIRKVFGTWLAYYLFTIRVLAAIFLSTGLTVSSGFVFNEVFVYWFPNFGFAYILLALLSGLHLLGPVVRTNAQIVFVGTALSGLVLLIGAGLVKGLPYTALPLSFSPMITLPWLFLPLIFFLGVDIGIPLEGAASHQLKETMQTLRTAIAVFGVLMILWAIVTTQNVTGTRLVATSISHMIIAREISGQFGRTIMGIIVIAGACAAVNALFEAVAQMASPMSKQKMLPRMRYTPQVIVLWVATAAAIMMAGGLAGEEKLESYIRAILLLWLGGYGLLQMYSLQIVTAGTSMNQAMRQSPNKVRLLTTAAVTFGGAAVLALTDARAMHIIKVMMTIIGVTLVLGAIGNWQTKRSTSNVSEKGGNNAENQH